MLAKQVRGMMEGLAPLQGSDHRVQWGLNWGCVEWVDPQSLLLTKKLLSFYYLQNSV